MEKEGTDLLSRPPDETVGKKISIFKKDSTEAPMDFKFWILEPDRDWLYDRINRRVDRMMGDGFLSEVQGLLDRGYTGNVKALRTLGYRQLIRYLEGEYSLERAVPLIKQETRRFAKRQSTWFRKSESTHRISLSSEGDLDRATEMIWNDPEIQTLVGRLENR